jgi:predicted DNA-binding transcriptional regulator AlpA
MGKELRVMAVAEIAQALGVSAGRVYQIIASDPTFPKPGATLRVGKIWRAEDIEEWARQAGRTLGTIATSASKPDDAAAGT